MQPAAAAEEAFLLLHGGTTACGGGVGGGGGGGRGGWHHPLHPDSEKNENNCGGGIYRRSLYPSLWLDEADDEEDEEGMGEEEGVGGGGGGGGKARSSLFGLLEVLPQDALMCVLGMLDAKEMTRLAATNSSVRARATGEDATWPWLQVCLQVSKEEEEEGGREEGRICSAFLIFQTHSFTLFLPSLSPSLTGMGPPTHHPLRLPLHLFLPPYLVPIHRSLAPRNRDGGPQALKKDTEHDEFGRRPKSRSWL